MRDIQDRETMLTERGTKRGRDGHRGRDIDRDIDRGRGKAEAPNGFLCVTVENSNMAKNLSTMEHTLFFTKHHFNPYSLWKKVFNYFSQF